MAVRSRIVPRWQPPAASPRRPRPRRPGWYAAPLQWWARHPWVVLWGLVVVGLPAGILGMRALDLAGRGSLVHAVAATLALALLAAVAATVVTSRTRGAPRTVAGIASAVVVTVLLVGAMMQPIGVRTCPPAVAGDRGAGASAAVLAAWKRGGVAADSFVRPADGQAFGDQSARAALLDYRAVDSGCWERLAPIDATRTWHEFRVTVRQGDRHPLSKLLVVHTVDTGAGWKVTEVEGPRP